MNQLKNFEPVGIYHHKVYSRQVEGGITLNHQIQHLLDWSEWGRQWVDYLRQNPHCAEMKRDLHKFHVAFSEVGRKANYYQDKEDREEQISKLASQAEDIQRHFHDLLRLVQNRKTEEENKEEEKQANSNKRGRFQRHPRVEQPSPPAIVPVVSEANFSNTAVPIGGHTLPPLPYSYDALEPYIDEETMRIHHDILHRNYVNNLNKAEKMMAQARETGNFDLIKFWEGEAAFNGAGHYLHTIFWFVMRPDGGGMPTGELASHINSYFGSFDKFKQHFSQAAEKVEGGGWAILVWSPRSHRLEILQAEKHQNLSQWDVVPLLALDVWEHAYFLSYRSQRADYIKAWWNIVNWEEVEKRFRQASRLRWKPF